MRIKKGDQVKVIAGRERGKSGKVLHVFADQSRVVVEGLHIVKKHVRPRREGEKGQRVEIAGKTNLSNVMVVCPKCGKATRLGYVKSGDQKMRVCKKCAGEF